jgi:UDP-glucose 4-epimerase
LVVSCDVTWLVTGGAGYIGAHVVHTLHLAGVRVVVLDNLSTGLAVRVPDGVALVKADVRDRAAVSGALAVHGVTGVIHLAARKDVGESLADPLGYYRDNVGGLRTVLSAAVSRGVRDIVFSSSAAVYGPAPTGRVDENSPTVPANPYGRTKLIGEWLLRDAAQTHGLRTVSLRYFNVAGAAAPALADVGATNLVPRLLRAVQEGRPAQVYGLDHSTADGSCVRDYVHVADIAEAHLVAATALREGRLDHDVLNIGRGAGVSVLEMIRAVRRICDQPLPSQTAPPRAGDPPCVVAAADRIYEALGWRARRDLDDIVSSAWNALRQA